jgi:hypothetical protein
MVDAILFSNKCLGFDFQGAVFFAAALAFNSSAVFAALVFSSCAAFAVLAFSSCAATQSSTPIV